MSTNWHLFDPNDVRISAMGNEAFGAYCRALRWCEVENMISIPLSTALAIAPIHVWELLATAAIVFIAGGAVVVYPMGNQTKKKRAPKTKCKIPADFVLTPERRQMALDENIDPRRIDAIFARFRDHWLSNGEMKADWDATWRNWCRSEFQDKDRIEPQKQRQQLELAPSPPPKFERMRDQSFLDRMAISAAKKVHR